VTAATVVTTAADHTLYAQWTANTYTVTFDPNGGSTPVPTSKVVTYGSAYGTLATTSRTGYTFNGWFTAASGGTQVTAATVVTTAADHTLYAQWTALSILGDVDGNGLVVSTDALIVLTADAGLDTAAYCPMLCGDTNADGLVNSTDALIILSFDVGFNPPFPVGQPGCPSSVTPPPGCGLPVGSLNRWFQRLAP
jgi:uncharacterized repeat protein (TIGR02543 family)